MNQNFLYQNYGGKKVLSDKAKAERVRTRT